MANREYASRFWVKTLTSCLVLGVAAILMWWSTRSWQETPNAIQYGADSQGELSSVSVGIHWEDLDNPSRDGWRTEVQSDAIQSRLDEIGGFAVGLQNNVDVVRKVAAADFVCSQLLPPSVELFADEIFQIKRALRKSVSSAAAEYRGPIGLVNALTTVSEVFRDSPNARFKIKLVDISSRDDVIMTRQLVSFSGQTKSGFVEQNSEWSTQWSTQGGTSRDSEPKLSSIDVRGFEQVTLKDQTTPLFSECTDSILNENESYRRQMLLGLDHWLGRIQDTRYFAPLGNPGLAVGDVNQDGLDDLYVCQEAGLPNRLFLQQPDGTALDASKAWGVDWLESSRSSLIIDLDNDGDQDLVVAILGGLLVARNDDHRFTVIEVLPTDDDTMTLAASDFDNDGDLDVYACVNYPNDFFAESAEISVLGGASNRVYHDANNAGRNALFRNDISSGEWRFTNVTAEFGLDVNNRRFSLGAAWEDFDDDGDQDLYVGNDFGRNNLYVNPGNQAAENGMGQFVDQAQTLKVEDSASGMSVAWGDTDRDGRMDLYVGNMFSAAGKRVTSQPQFKPGASDEVRTRLRRFARGNTLFRNSGDGTGGDGSFHDVSLDSGVNVGRWAWSSNFLDINNDGWEDLLVANGYITTDDTSDL